MPNKGLQRDRLGWPAEARLDIKSRCLRCNNDSCRLDKPVQCCVCSDSGLDGNLWQFGKLSTDIFTKNSENFTIEKLPRLYGALEYLARLVEQEDMR